MKKIKSIAVYTIFMLVASLSSFAQGPGFDPDIDPSPNPYATPISDDIWILVVAGLVLGTWRFMKMRSSMKVA